MIPANKKPRSIPEAIGTKSQGFSKMGASAECAANGWSCSSDFIGGCVSSRKIATLMDVS